MLCVLEIVQRLRTGNLEVAAEYLGELMIAAREQARSELLP